MLKLLFYLVKLRSTIYHFPFTIYHLPSTFYVFTYLRNSVVPAPFQYSSFNIFAHSMCCGTFHVTILPARYDTIRYNITRYNCLLLHKTLPSLLLLVRFIYTYVRESFIMIYMNKLFPRSGFCFRNYYSNTIDVHCVCIHWFGMVLVFSALAQVCNNFIAAGD